MLIKLLIISLTTCAIASPLPAQKQLDANKILYDQRQEGEWNVRADLKNFVILIIPTPVVSTSPSSSPSLLDFLFKKSLPTRSNVKKIKTEKAQSTDAAQETMHFIESKSAPYHVDITQTKEELAKLHPNTGEEVLVASSPTVALVKAGTEIPVENLSPSNRAARISRAFVFTVPGEEEFVVTKTEDSKKVVKKDGKKKIVKEIPKHALKLLGAENEQCGPGMERNSYGICRTYGQLLKS